MKQLRMRTTNCIAQSLAQSLQQTITSFQRREKFKTKLNPGANTRNSGKEGRGLASCIDVAYLLLTCN